MTAIVRLLAILSVLPLTLACAQDYPDFEPGFGLPTGTADTPTRSQPFEYVGPGSSVAAGAMPETVEVLPGAGSTDRSRQAGTMMRRGVDAAGDGIAFGTRKGIKRSPFISSFGTKSPGVGRPGSSPYSAPAAEWTDGTAGGSDLDGPGSTADTGDGTTTGDGSSGDGTGSTTTGTSDGTGGDDGSDPVGNGRDPTVVATGDVTANGVNFTVGPYLPPDIAHDNGFLQNTNDVNDPVPVPLRDPTPEEIDFYNDQVSDVRWGDWGSWLPVDRWDERFSWDNAIPAYRHFLEGEGADRTFDMDAYLTEDPAGQVVEQSLLNDSESAIDSALYDLDASGQLKPGEPVTFTITSDPVNTEIGDPFYPYPSTVDWQRTVGGMAVWTTTEVTATMLEDGTIEISTTTTIHGEDRYNFNRGQAAIDSGELDSIRGVLEESGLAQQYTQTGSTTRSDNRTLKLP